MSTLVYIGEQIKELRKKANLSQDELSINCNIDRAQISRIESGEVLGVSLATIEKILESLNYELTIKKLTKEDKEYEIHPVVKWAGGKTQILNDLIKYFPCSFNTYYEPFFGGGALFFKIQPKKFVINDLNTDLMSIYSCFLNDELYINLIKELKIHEKNHSEEYYYAIRDLDRNKDQYNLLPIYKKAARTIYLNKACFNGLYRVNSKGFFNVPSGKKDKVKCFDKDNFKNIKEFFTKRKGNKITSLDFEKAVKNAKKGDFVYFDPPYDTLDNKKSFTAYSKDSFNKDEQARLARVFKELDQKGVYVMLSNHNTVYIRELYEGYNFHIVLASRMINSKGDGRGKIEEVIITNYETK